jgi:hypothetical protein
VQRLLLSVMLLCVACGPIEGDAFDAGAMDAGEVLVDGGADDGGDLIDKQNGTNAYPSEWPKPEDFHLLPYSLLMRPKYVYGFDTTLLPAIWVYNDWPGENVSWLGRDGVGSWYRARSYSTTMGYVARDILPKPYTCQTGFWGAECVSAALGNKRKSISCPFEMVMNEVPYQWRSRWSDWPTDHIGWFFWDGSGAYERWFTTADTVRLKFLGVTITGMPTTGQQVSCNYQTIDPNRSYGNFDLWLQRR